MKRISVLLLVAGVFFAVPLFAQDKEKASQPASSSVLPKPLDMVRQLGATPADLARIMEQFDMSAK